MESIHRSRSRECIFDELVGSLPAINMAVDVGGDPLIKASPQAGAALFLGFPQ